MAPTFEFRRLALASAALAVALALAGAASAAPVTRQADLRLTIDFRSLPDEYNWGCWGYPPYPESCWFRPAIVINSTGATVTVDSTTGSLSIAAGALSHMAPITIPFTSTTALASVKASGIRNLSGVFSLGGGAVTSPTTELPCPSASPVAAGIGCVAGGASALGGQMGLSGTIFAVIVPMMVTLPVPLATVGVGVGGFTRIPNTPAGFLFDAAPWTQGVGKLAFTTTSRTTSMYTSMGFPITVTYTMSWTTVARETGAGGTVNTPASGTITLVTPIYLSALGNYMPIVSTLEIHFVPEPGTLLLVGAGIGGLVLVGRRRR